MTSFVRGLKCRLCGKTYPREPLNFCTDDFGPLEADYDYGYVEVHDDRLLTRAAEHAGQRLGVGRVDLLVRHVRRDVDEIARTRLGDEFELLPGEKIKHKDVYSLQRTIGRPFTWTALLTIKGYPWHEGMAELNQKERSTGADVWPQVSVRPLVFSMNMVEPFTFNMNPIFAALMDKTVDEKLAAFRDPEWRKKAQEELDEPRFFKPKWEKLAGYENGLAPNVERWCYWWGRGY